MIRLLALGVLLLAPPLAAQVGHDPNRSPYRDIIKGKSLSFLYGDIGGDGGKLGIGPHNGPSYGVRFDLRLGTPIQFGLTVAKANLTRLIVSADDSVNNRVDGPVDQNLTMFEAALQLNLTGRKSWHHLAPYLGGSLGYLTGSSLPASQPDSSGYKFGSKFYVAPTVGLRILLGQSLQLRLEARQLYWKLTYPTSYRLEPAAQPSSDPNNPNAVLQGGKLDQWTGGREFRAGLGFSF